VEFYKIYCAFIKSFLCGENDKTKLSVFDYSPYYSHTVEIHTGSSPQKNRPDHNLDYDHPAHMGLRVLSLSTGSQAYSYAGVLANRDGWSRIRISDLTI
jgi:hypothetical protein